jgi:hypothetical protein
MMRRFRGKPIGISCVAAGFILIAASVLMEVPVRALTAQELRFLSGYHALLEVSPDECRIAPRLETEYKRLLSRAAPEQDVADIRAVLEGKPGIPLRFADGVRLSDAFALYDSATNAVYLSSPSVASHYPAAGGRCPSDQQVSDMARDTIGIYVHEISHALERRALGDDDVETSEGEILAYSRESRFLSGFEGWPAKTVTEELHRQLELHDLIQENEEILDRVSGLRGEEPNDENLKKLKDYVETLDGIHRKIDGLKQSSVDVDPLQMAMAQMVETWRESWPKFIHLMMRQTEKAPSLSRREENLQIAHRFLGESRAALKDEKPGTLAYELVRRSVSLAKQDVRFWGDAKKVEKALDYCKKGFKEVRPPPKGEAANNGGEK